MHHTDENSSAPDFGKNLMREMYKKRGRNYYHRPCSGPLDLNSTRARQLNAFALSVHAHIMGWLRTTYSKGKQDTIC
jgi:hypothetical protein